MAVRETWAVYLELSLAGLLPVWKENCEARGIDPSIVRVRYELCRIEADGIPAGQEGKFQEAMRQAARPLVKQLGEMLDPDHWEKFGRVYLDRVADAPNPKEAFRLAGANPAQPCPKCGKPMMRRNGRNNSVFYGCPDYPGCRGTRPISA